MTFLQAALDGIERYITERLPRSDSPGVVVGVTDRERLLGIATSGLADVASGTPVLPDARFQIGSISKSFAVFIAMQEVEAGRLDLQAPVTDYVPWFAVRSRFAPITTHHLLNHTSGLIQGTDFSPDHVHEVWALRETECTYAPGERFFYSNDGFKLVGLILEAVTGRPFIELLEERIFGPLGMADSDPAITLAARATVALPHQRLFDDRPPHAGQPLITSPWYETCSADGSIVSTAADMCAYARLLLGGGATQSARVISPESYALMTRRLVEYDDEPGAWYGYGLVTREHDGRVFVGHSGGMVGYSSFLMTDPEAGLGAIVLMNGNEDRRELVLYALEAARAAVAGAPVPPPPPPADPTLIADAGQYAGRYRLCGAGPDGERPLVAATTGVAPVADEVTLSASDGRLFLSHAGEEVALESRDPDIFVAPHPAWDRFCLSFGRDTAGAVVELFCGPDWYVNDRYAGPRETAPHPEWRAFVGHYRSWSEWMVDLRVFERKDKLWLSGPWVEGSGFELELVPLGEGHFRMGAEEWRQDRVTVDSIIDGRATRVLVNQAPLYRAFTP